MTASDAGAGGDSSPVRLRAHHLLCIQGFQGHGYSEGFVDNMATLVGLFVDEPDTLVTVVEGCDDVCSACPHCQEDACVKDEGSDEVVSGMDRAVLAAIGRDEGATGTAGELFSEVNTALAARKDALVICGDCSWGDACMWLGARED